MTNKVYILESNNGYSSDIIGVFTSKLEAEYEKWILNKDSGMGYIYRVSHVLEIEIQHIDFIDNKKFKEFKKYRIKQLKGERERLDNRKDTDENKIKDILFELEELNK